MIIAKYFRAVASLAASLLVLGFFSFASAQPDTAESNAEHPPLLIQLQIEAYDLYTQMNPNTPAGLAAVAQAFEASKTLCETYEILSNCQLLSNIASQYQGPANRFQATTFAILKSKCAKFGYSGDDGMYCEIYGHALSQNEKIRLATEIYKKRCDAGGAAGCSDLAVLYSKVGKSEAADASVLRACKLDVEECPFALKFKGSADKTYFAGRLEKKCSDRDGLRHSLGHACMSLAVFRWQQGKPDVAFKLFATGCKNEIPEACVMESAILLRRDQAAKAHAAVLSNCPNRRETVVGIHLKEFYDRVCSNPDKATAMIATDLHFIAKLFEAFDQNDYGRYSSIIYEIK